LPGRRLPFFVARRPERAAGVSIAPAEDAMTRARLAGGVATVVLLAWSASACGHGADGEAGARAPIPVRVKVVQKRAGAAATRYSGTIVPAVQVDLAFRVGGYVQQILQVKDG